MADSGGLEGFLSRFRIEGGRCPTHTRFGNSFGSYYIPAPDNDEFFRVYARHLAAHRFSKKFNGKACVGLVERHRDFGPIVIDLDFRFEPATDVEQRQHEPKRRHTRQHIEHFIRKYVNFLPEWIVPPKSFSVIVMEKPGARMEKGVVKDGVHIVIPEIVTHTRVQILIRREFLKKFDSVLFEDLKLSNKICDVFDEAVIQRNGWMMYGSGKENDAFYEPVWGWNVKVGYCDFDISPVSYTPPDSEDAVYDLVKLLSIRNKEEHTLVRPEKEADVDHSIRVEEMAKAEIRRNPRLQDAQTGRVYATTDEYEMARRLAPLLDDERANDYASWIQVGLCLHNIDDRLVSEWIAFSQLSPKFEPGLCDNLWSHMSRKIGGVGMGSLRRWAKQDSPALYEKIIKECVSGHVQAAISGLHHDVAMVVKGMYATAFVCSSIRNNSWFQFLGHRWQICDSGYYLRRLLSSDIFNRFMDEAAEANHRAQAHNEDIDRDNNARAKVLHAQCAEMNKKLIEVAVKLKDSRFKDSVMRECKELFYEPKFESELDTKPNIIGFENGVYDLDTHDFRDGLPEDMVSFSTGYSYVPFDEGHECVRQINHYFSQVQPDERVREYLLRLLGSYLSGSIREERFHFFTGTGSNSKSISIDLFERALGDYCCKLPVSLLTQKRAASNQATSEIARLKGRRFACLQEPSPDETLNVGLMKELTGGDRIMARQLYREPIEFRSFARLALICNNLPNIPSSDGGTWRRIRVIHFPSKFCSEPDPNDPLQFPIDTCLVDNLSRWAPHMMSMLIEKYKLYCVSGNKEPDPVMRVTVSYQESQDAVKLFLNHFITVDKNGEVAVADLHSMYKDFIRQMAITGLSQRRLEFIKEMERHLNIKAVGTGSGQRFCGISIKKSSGEGPEED